MPTDDLNDMLAFARVAELGSFTAAAQRLGQPKSTVSARVARLEERLGVRLLERSTRKLRLTDIGARYLEHARRALQSLEHANACVEAFHAEPGGTLRISAPVVLGQTLLPQLLADYAAAHPQVQLFVELSNRRVDLLEEGFDLALRAGSLADSTLVARRVGVGGTRLFASPAYLAARGVPATPAELAGHDLLEGNPSAQAAGWAMRHNDGQEQQLAAHFRMICNDPIPLLAAARAGLGIASLATFVVQDELAAGRLLPVLPDWATRRLEVFAVYPSHRGLSPALRAFVDLAAERLPPMLGVSGFA